MREAARLQSFPDSFYFGGSMGSKFINPQKMFTNNVNSIKNHMGLRMGTRGTSKPQNRGNPATKLNFPWAANVKSPPL